MSTVRPISRVVILGHSGFIGSNLCEAFRSVEGLEVKGLSYPDVDMTNESCRELLIEAFDKETVVVLLSAVKRQFGDTLDVYHQNMAIVENVVAAVSAKPVARVAFMSSAAVYGEETHNTDIKETTPVNPTSFYGIAKFTGECILRKFFAADGPSLICFRPPTVYGPGDMGRTYGPAGFSSAIKDGKPITLWGDGTELREFVYIRDLCQMIKHLTLGHFEGAVNLVTGVSYNFVNILDALRGISPAPFDVNQRERSKQKVDNAFDSALVRSLLPAEFTFTPLEEGIRNTFNSLV